MPYLSPKKNYGYYLLEVVSTTYIFVEKHKKILNCDWAFADSMMARFSSTLAHLTDNSLVSTKTQSLTWDMYIGTFQFLFYCLRNTTNTKHGMGVKQTRNNSVYIQ